MAAAVRMRNTGFTLIELMVTIAIAAILMAVAVPGFLAYQRSSAVLAAATSFASALNIARAEAIKRSLPTFVQPDKNNDWKTGWRVFVDANSNGKYDGGDVVLLEPNPLSADVSLATNASAPGFVDSTNTVYVRYDGSGNPSPITPAAMNWPNGIEFVATAGTQVTKRRVALSLVGRARICDPVKNTPPCP